MRKGHALIALRHRLLVLFLALGALGCVGLDSTAAAAGLPASGARTSSTVQVSTVQSSQIRLVTQTRTCISQENSARPRCSAHTRSISTSLLARFSITATTSWSTLGGLSSTSWGTFSAQECLNGTCSAISHTFQP